MASRQPSYPSTFTRVDVPRVLPAADPPSTDDPRVAAFVRSQVEHLPTYKEEGISSFADWLEEQARLDEEDRRTTSGTGKHARSAFPARSSEGGIRAVDILADVRREEKSSSSASVIKEGSSGPSRVRMADRMKGKDGAERQKKRVSTGAHQPRTDDSNTAATKVKHEYDTQDGPQASQQTDIVLTRKELSHRATAHARPTSPHNARLESPPAQPRPSKRHSRPSDTSKDDPHRPDEDHKKRRRLEPLDERCDDDLADANQPSPPPKPKHTTKPAPRSSKKDAPASVKPSSSSKPTKVKAKPTSISRPAPSSGKENQGDDAEERAVRLEERKRRRRAKAAILKPKPRPPSSASTSSSMSSSPASSESSETDQDSRRKTRRVKQRRDDKEDGSDRPKKKKSKKDDKKGTKKKKENRDLGTSLGMGLGIMDTFRADNVGGGAGRRLTLKRDLPKPGVFNKGRASSKVDTKDKRSREPVGVPDLVFSEARFLSRPRPPPGTPSIASVDLPPRRRTVKPRSSKPSPPSQKRKARHTRSAHAEGSAEEQEQEASDEDEGGPRPIDTVSKFFAVTKTGTKVAPGQSEKMRAVPNPSARKRVEYSPSWPETVDQEENQSRAALRDVKRPDGRAVDSASSSPSVGRQHPKHSSVSSRSHSKSDHRIASTSGPRRPPTQPSSAPHSPHRDTDHRTASRPRSGVFPLPVSRRPFIPLARDGRRHHPRLMYDGDSSVGEFEDQQPATWHDGPDPPRPGSGPQPDLSDLGEEADVFRIARWDASGRDVQQDEEHNVEALGDFDDDDAGGSYADDRLVYDQADETYGDHHGDSFDGQQMAGPNDDYQPADDDPAYPSAQPYRHRVAFQTLHEQHEYATDIQDGRAFQSDASEEGEDQMDEEEDALIDDEVVPLSMDVGMDWSGHWRPHRT